MIIHRLIPTFYLLLVIVSYSTLANDGTEAQPSENMLESIVNQTKLLTSAQLSVGSGPSYIATLEGAIYVANSGSNTVSVIDPNTNTVIKLKHMKLGTIVLLQ